MPKNRLMRREKKEEQDLLEIKKKIHENNIWGED